MLLWLLVSRAPDRAMESAISVELCTAEYGVLSLEVSAPIKVLVGTAVQ